MNSTISFPSTVFGAVLNDQQILDQLGAALHQPPYQKPPTAPVLYIKTRNTFAPPGVAVPVPESPGVVQVDATIGVVIGRSATRLTAANAMEYVAGYLVVSDLTLPHDSFYRPAVRHRCRDLFCPMSEVIAPAAAFDPLSAVITVSINGQEVHRRNLTTLVRSLPQLLEDVTQFMTLSAGDVLLVGPPAGAPTAKAGDTVRIDVSNLGSLTHTLVAEKTWQEAS